MADSYTLFATTFCPVNEAQMSFMQAAFAAHRIAAGADVTRLPAWLEENGVEADEPATFLDGVTRTYHPAKGDAFAYLYLASKECGSLEDLAQLVAAAQRKFPEDTEVWMAAGASTCSAMKVDEFGGYAVCVHRGVISRISTTQWMYEQVRKFLEQEKEQHA